MQKVEEEEQEAEEHCLIIGEDSKKVQSITHSEKKKKHQADTSITQQFFGGAGNTNRFTTDLSTGGANTGLSPRVSKITVSSPEKMETVGQSNPIINSFSLK